MLYPLSYEGVAREPDEPIRCAGVSVAVEGAAVVTWWIHAPGADTHRLYETDESVRFPDLEIKETSRWRSAISFCYLESPGTAGTIPDGSGRRRGNNCGTAPAGT